MVDSEVESFIAKEQNKCNRLLKESLPILSDIVSEVSTISLFDDFGNSIDKNHMWRTHNNFSEKNTTLNESDNKIGIRRRCPPIFDGLLCWSHIDAPGIAVLPCPPAWVTKHTNLSDDNLKALAVASKVCLENGEWYRNAENTSWSNYSLCTSNSELYVIDAADESKYPRNFAEFLLLIKWLPITRMVSEIGYAVSFTTLIVAMVVFSLLRKLRNPRNRLHMHLFASFIMRAFMALLKDWIFTDAIGLGWDVVLVNGKNTFIKEHNIWICKIITSLWQYFIVANYSWILMEGLYLHNLVFLAFCADTSTISFYILLGWGLPILIMIPWIIIRVTMENTLCWITHENSSLVIRIPIIISILFNFVLFLNIIRVLFVKLKTSVHLQRKKMQYKRWAKSTLVLVPLFGTHYTFFLGLSYYKDHHIELIWLFCDQLFASFQGALVALLYCLLNGEVRAEMRRAWKARRSKRDVDSFISGHRELSRNSKSRSSRERHRSEGDNGTNLPMGIAKRELSL